MSWKRKHGGDLQDSEVFETGEVRLADDRQVVSVQIAEKRTRRQRIREQEVNCLASVEQ